MESLTTNEVRGALVGWLGESAIVDVSRETPADRITGWIVHPGFSGVSHATRQLWLWEGLDQEAELPAWPGLKGTFGERATQIGLILAYSLVEFNSIMEESA